MKPVFIELSCECGRWAAEMIDGFLTTSNSLTRFNKTFVRTLKRYWNILLKSG